MVSQNTVEVMDDPLGWSKPAIYPENGYVFAFRQYITKLLNGKSAIFDPDFINYIILPYRINILHVLAFCMKTPELK